MLKNWSRRERRVVVGMEELVMVGKAVERTGRRGRGIRIDFMVAVVAVGDVVGEDVNEWIMTWNKMNQGTVVTWFPAARLCLVGGYEAGTYISC